MMGFSLLMCCFILQYFLSKVQSFVCFKTREDRLALCRNSDYCKNACCKEKSYMKIGFCPKYVD